MYKILLGQQEPPEDVTPAFIDDEMAEFGNKAQIALSRRQLFQVSVFTNREQLDC